MTDGIEISDDYFPILVQTLHTEVTDADVEKMIVWYDEYLHENEERYAVVVAATETHRGLNATQRKRVNEWQAEVEARTRRLCVCSAIVLHSAFQRGALTALNWVYPPPVPQRAFASVPEGFDWVVERLEDLQIHIPAAVRRHQSRLRAEAG